VLAPVLQPDKVWTPEESGSLNLPAPKEEYPDYSVSPDGSVGVMHDSAAKTLEVYEGSTWQEHHMPQGGELVHEIPEFWQPPVYGGYWVGGEFSPDGHYLLVTWGKRIGALLFDTTTWQPVTDPRLFPQNLKEYLHAPDWNLGIAVNDAGEALVWDQQSHRLLSKLPGLGEFEPPPVITDRQGHRVYDVPNAEVQFAAFSPDRTRGAIYSGPDNVYKLHLTVWDIESGQKLREFWPVEWLSYANGQPVWWGGGRWLVARYAAQFGPSGIGLWDVETGRYKGTLGVSDKCSKWDDLVASGPRLFERCLPGDGKAGEVLEWTVDGVTKQMDSAPGHVATGSPSD
jgi:hypothetical protein